VERLIKRRSAEQPEDWNMDYRNTIRQATKAACIDEQRHCARLARAATAYLKIGNDSMATCYQHAAARHYQEMWMRLERLIGVA
jgi:hypothetical protein